MSPNDRNAVRTSRRAQAAVATARRQATDLVSDPRPEDALSGHRGRAHLAERRPRQGGRRRQLHIRRGETLGLVGEFGCGKTTPAAASCSSSARPTARSCSTARIWSDLDQKSMRALRQQIQVIFQDPYSSLNPRMKIGEIIAEPIEVHAHRAGQGGTRRAGRGAAAVCRPAIPSSPTATRTR